MMRRGFTIVELVITITVMAILLTLAVVNLSATQMNARDAERKADIEAIQLSLEDYYQTDSDRGTYIGAYPNITLDDSVANMKAALRDINTDNLMAPGITDPTVTFKAATNNTQTTAGVTPQPTIDQYIYQPIDVDGSLCGTTSTTCRKYNLYYHLEGDNTIYMVTSKHQ